MIVGANHVNDVAVGCFGLNQSLNRVNDVRAENDVILVNLCDFEYSVAPRYWAASHRANCNDVVVLLRGDVVEYHRGHRVNVGEPLLGFRVTGVERLPEHRVIGADGLLRLRVIGVDGLPPCRSSSGPRQRTVHWNCQNFT